MAHELSEVNGVTEMFYAGKQPWHGLGKPVDNALTAEEAIDAAHLRWPVQKRRVYFKKDDGDFQATNRYATVRTDIELPLGVVSESYKPIQNDEAFTFCDELVKSGDAKYITAGALNDGQRIWLLAQLPGHIRIKGDDIMNKFLLFHNSHNGRDGAEAMITPVRVVCQNTLALARAKSTVRVNIHHRGDVDRKVAEAREILGISINYFEKLTGMFKIFAERYLTGKEIKMYLDGVITSRSVYAENIKEKILELHESGMGSEMARGTIWGVYNAVIEYVDHHRVDPTRKPDKYLNSTIFGKGADIKALAYEKAELMVIGN